MNATVTQSQMERVTREWSGYAGEPVRVQATSVDGPVYAFGSELACLRLYLKMGGKGRAAYSENLRSWYYCTK